MKVSKHVRVGERKSSMTTKRSILTNLVDGQIKTGLQTYTQTSSIPEMVEAIQSPQISIAAGAQSSYPGIAVS